MSTSDKNKKSAFEIFCAAQEHSGNAESQAAYVVGACGDDEALRREVEELLKSSREAGSFLQEEDKVTSIFATPNTGSIDEAVGAQIDRYKLLQKIGEGGFGVVFMAEQQEPVRRKVALKIIKPGMDTKEVVARFEAERQALALMDHPNVARVLDGGATESGRPFFAMELVKGVPLTEFCDANKLSIPDRLQLFISICRAIQHAHQKGIIHRDLKPSNVMVTIHDNRPVPKIIDFGVSKALSQQLTEKTLFTAYGQMVGTPIYMSPEQAQFSGLDIDTRSDIYSLGVMLYELLTGTTPLDAQRLRSTAYAEIQRMIAEEEAARPSTRLSTLGDKTAAIAIQRDTEPGKLQQAVSGDLDWIVMKALDKDRNRRYESASNFAADVERYLVDESVEARPPSMSYQLQKFVRRNRSIVVTVSALFALLCLGLLGTTWGLVEARKQTQNAIEQEAIAKAASKEATTEKDHALKSEQDAIKEKTKAEKAQAAEEAIARQRRRELYASDMQLADQLYKGQNGEQKRIEQILASWIPVDDQEDLREFSWRYQWNRLHNGAEINVQECKGVAITPTGKLVVADTDGLHEVDDKGQKIKLIGWELKHSWPWFSPDGRWVASKFESGVELYHIESGKKVLSLLQTRASFSPNGKYFAAWKGGAKVDSLAEDEDAIPVWRLDGENATPIDPLVIGDQPRLPKSANALKLGSDGKSHLGRMGINVVAYLNGNAEPAVWVNGGTANYAWSPDGKIIASTSGGTVELRLNSDVSKKRTLEKLTISTHGKFITTLRFSPDGNVLGTGANDGTIDLWDVSALVAAIEQFETQDQEVTEKQNSRAVAITSLPGPRLIQTIKAFTSGISNLDMALSFSRDNSLLATRNDSGNVKRWDLNNVPGKYQMDQVSEDIYGWSVSLNGISEDEGYYPHILTIRPDEILEGSAEAGERIVAIFDTDKGDWFVRDGMETWYDFELLLRGARGSKIRMRLEDSAGTQHEATLRRKHQIANQSPRSFSVAFAPNGNGVLVGDCTLGATRLNLNSREAIRYPQAGMSAAYSPDGRLVALDSRNAISIQDLKTGKEIYQLDSLIDADWNPNTFGGHLTFSPNGQYLAHVSSHRYSSTRSDLNVWRTSDFKKVVGGPLHQTDFSMKAPVFSPDSSRLFVGNNFGHVQVWDTSDWSQQAGLPRSQPGLVSMAISSDGNRLVTGSYHDAGGVCIWDLETGMMLRKLSTPSVGWLALSPDDRTLAVGGLDHNVVLWDMETGKQLQTIQAHSDAISGVAFSQGGNRLATVSFDGVLRVWDAGSTAEIEKDQKTLLAMFRLALSRFEQEDYVEAEALFSKVVELNRKSGRPIDSELKSVQWKIRQTLQKTGKWHWHLKWESKFVGARLGEQATLSVQPIEGDWTYQWYCNYEPIEGATNPTLTLSNITADQIGTYQVKIAPQGYESVISHLAGDAYLYDAFNPVIPGTLFCEIFQNIKGKTVENLTSSRQYQNTTWWNSRSLKTFEAPYHGGSHGNNYGIRVTGCIKPPKTGEYVFYLASDDEGEFYLSSDESSDNLELVASVKRGPSGIGNESGRTNKRAWGANPSAVSKSIHLEAGKRYAVKALMKEDSGAEHLSVNWQVPGDPVPKKGSPPISGKYLEFEVPR